MERYFIRFSSLYLILGLAIGYFMGITDLFQYNSLHVHVNLVGWVTSVLFGIVYMIYQSPKYKKLITAHFWIHMIGFPLLVLGMYFIIEGNGAIGGPLSGLGGTLVIIGAILFSVFCFKANYAGNK